MKKRNLLMAVTVLIVLVGFRTVYAAPCGAMDSTLLNGTFTLTHTELSTKKPLQKVTLFPAAQAARSKRMLGDGAPFTVHDVLWVSNLQFASTAHPDEIRLLQKTSQVAIVTRPNSPDLCFLLWFSSENQLLDVNVILSQNGAGDMGLGSYNKLDGNLNMTLTRDGVRRK